MTGWEPHTTSDHDWGELHWPEPDDAGDESEPGNVGADTTVASHTTARRRRFPEPEPGNVGADTTDAADTTARRRRFPESDPDPVTQRRADAAAHAAATADPPWQHLRRPTRIPAARTGTGGKRLAVALAAVAAVIGIAVLSPGRTVVNAPAPEPFAAEVDRSGLITLDQTELAPIGSGDAGIIFLDDETTGDVRQTSVRAELAVIETVMRADPDLDVVNVAGLVAAQAPEQIQVLVMDDTTSGDWCVQVGDGVVVLHLDAGDTITAGRC